MTDVDLETNRRARAEVERVVSKITTRQMPWPVKLELLPGHTSSVAICVRVVFRIWSVDDAEHQIELIDDARLDPYIIVGTHPAAVLHPIHNTAEHYIKEKIYKVIKELWMHELHERLLFDGQLWIDPHEGQPLAPGLRENARQRVAKREAQKAADRKAVAFFGGSAIDFVVAATEPHKDKP